ncbi:hypothetical protein ACU686_24165 [Yinghuangia aomiensis]
MITNRLHAVPASPGAEPALTDLRPTEPMWRPSRRPPTTWTTRHG